MVGLKILHVAQGKAFADVAVINGQIVNVHTREIYPRGGAGLPGIEAALKEAHDAGNIGRGFMGGFKLTRFPEYSVTNHGYVDCIRPKKMELVLEFA
jgi:hypothetical protein